MEKVKAFLERHGMEPERVQPSACADNMLLDMRKGLAGGESDMPMHPAFLSNDRQLPLGEMAAVIDAGGTNFRRALVHFESDGCHVEELQKSKMPGTGEPCTWADFISYVADSIEPLMDRTDKIGFCFSYSARITPEMDGIVDMIDKEVVIRGCEGKSLAADLIKELERRGISGKKVVILNDTVAVLLGGCTQLDKGLYSGFAGQVSGTGTNTCVSLPERDIVKLGRSSERGMIVNLESGLYAGERGGDFDKVLDGASNNPGVKIFEKLSSGAYLGELCRIMLCAAAGEGLISEDAGESLREPGCLDSAVADMLINGEGCECFAFGEEDGSFVRELCRAVFVRSARCMCGNLLALRRLTGAGTDEARPFCVIAEGSLVQRSRVYRAELERLLAECCREEGVYISLVQGKDTTLPGAAAAALLNG